VAISSHSPKHRLGIAERPTRHRAGSEPLCQVGKRVVLWIARVGIPQRESLFCTGTVAVTAATAAPDMLGRADLVGRFHNEARPARLVTQRAYIVTVSHEEASRISASVAVLTCRRRPGLADGWKAIPQPDRPWARLLSVRREAARLGRDQAKWGLVLTASLPARCRFTVSCCQERPRSGGRSPDVCAEVATSEAL
jgi:hypothetical protein